MVNEWNSPIKLHQLCPQRRNIIQVAAIIGMCSLFYVLGVWINTSSPVTLQEIHCISNTVKVSSSVSLDFELHHSASLGEVSNRSRSFPPCDMKYSEYTPCEDSKRSLKFSRDRLMYRERHCPEKNESLKCLIPAPPAYKNPFPWPNSRDFAWFANVPHRELTIEKAVQNWVQVIGDKFHFPGGGTMFPHGADAYIDDINLLIPLTDGTIRTAIDTGCGVASWGAYLLKRNVLTMSFAPRDSHEAQVQFALERGIPAMIGIMSSNRLPYPARAFDMAHCSRCLIPWNKYGGMYLFEVDRILRPGGYWVLSGPPIHWKKHFKGWNRTAEDLKQEQDEIEDFANSLCWKKIAENNDLAIWQKPSNHMNCVKTRRILNVPGFCQDDIPDAAWYKKMETCISPLPQVNDNQDIAGGVIEKWPLRLTAIPPRISSGSMAGITAENFTQDTQLWKDRVTSYKKIIDPLAHGRYRNIMDMNAHMGGFSAALANDPVWVMNVVPVDAKDNTLGIIYERGLIGTYHDWCESFSTYPRSYDLIHASGVISMYQDRCDVDDILLEMDRILRPEGTVILRDDIDTLAKIQNTISGMRWKSWLANHETGPFAREKLLIAVKEYWTGTEKATESSL
ncbi:probable methyltransferase PMT17 [Cryptomeria japonica]|uniref:probable methyltransferase PMT17 n=1 Tax=Cryptomeria japonica TaxID=3369 RepID=UPI0027DA7544|nr:probable methyltransferase PMT17 [Cryptomeria japonica]XP_057858391.2 probable methyltransferase PMT17 [Cryptomeria japonica]